MVNPPLIWDFNEAIKICNNFDGRGRISQVPSPEDLSKVGDYYGENFQGALIFGLHTQVSELSK